MHILNVGSVQVVLPPGKYIVDSCTSIGDSFQALLHADVKTEAGAISWLKEHERLTLLTFRVSKTWPDTGVKVLFKVLKTDTIAMIVLCYYGSMMLMPRECGY